VIFNALEEVGGETVVGIHKDQYVSFGMFGALIALDTDVASGGGENRKMGKGFDKRLGFRDCLVVRLPINDDDLEVVKSLGGEIPQELGKIFGFV